MMSNLQENTPAPRARRRWRRLWAAVLIAGLAFIGYRLVAGAPLHPVTQRVLPRYTYLKYTLGEYGYPFAEATCGPPTECIPVEMVTAPLDARGRPTTAPLDQRGVVNAPMPPYLPRGPYKNLVQAPGPAYLWSPNACVDRRYLALRRQAVGAPKLSDDRLYIYDLTRGRLVLSPHFFSTPPGPGKASLRVNSRQEMFSALCTVAPSAMPVTVFTAGDRFLAVPAVGKAQLFSMREKTYTFGAFDTVWNFGEDGTLWRQVDWEAKNTIEVLDWRHGVPRLLKRTLPGPVDSRFYDASNRQYYAWVFVHGTTTTLYTNIPTPWTAVWGDGALVACTQTVRVAPPTVVSMLQRGWALLGQRGPFPRERRRLILYRHGHRLGTFTIPLQPTNSQDWPYAEHLAFTKDGRYLCWVIDPGSGRQQVYVFAVPRAAVRLW